MRKRGPQWSTVTIALAVIAAVAIAVPAFGLSGSIKSAIKKEVAKQIKSARGPAGPRGATGTAGIKGATGTVGPQGPGAVRLTFAQPASDGVERTIGVINELTLSAYCGTVAAGRATLYLYAYSDVDGATLHGLRTLTENDGPLSSLVVATGVATDRTTVGVLFPAVDGEFMRGFMQATYTNGGREITLDMYTVANDANGGSCEVHGTAVPSS